MAKFGNTQAGTSYLKYRPKGSHRKPMPDVYETQVYWTTIINKSLNLTASDSDNTTYYSFNINNLRDPDAQAGTSQYSALGYYTLQQVYQYYVVKHAYVRLTYFQQTSGIQSNTGTMWCAAADNQSPVPGKVLYDSNIKFSYPKARFVDWPQGHENRNKGVCTYHWYPSYHWPARSYLEEPGNYGNFKTNVDPTNVQYILAGYSRPAIGSGASAIVCMLRCEIWFDVICARVADSILIGDEGNWVPFSVLQGTGDTTTTIDAAPGTITGDVDDLPDDVD